MKQKYQFRAIDQIMDPQTDCNCDWIAVNNHCVVWLDGAAPFDGKGVTRYANDAVWFVRRFAEVFLDLVRENMGTEVAIVETQSQLFLEYQTFIQGHSSRPSEAPFACLGVARLMSDVIEFVNVGDCRLLFEGGSSAMSSFGFNTVSFLDAEVLQSLTEIRSASAVSHQTALRSVVPIIQRNRLLRNRLFGYSVVEPRDDFRPEYERIILPAVAGRRFLAMTDGFYRAVDTYKLADDVQLFHQSFHGLHEIVNDIRSAENRDCDALAFPRLKLADDAAAVAFTIEEIT